MQAPYPEPGIREDPETPASRRSPGGSPSTNRSLPFVLLIVLFAAVAPAPLAAGQAGAPSDPPATGTSAIDTATDRSAPPPADERHPVRRAPGEMDVDGVLEEAAWEQAAPIRLPWEASPGQNEPAPVETRCMMTYDADRLYFACRALDPAPEDIRAHLAERDTPFDDDHVTVLLDTFGDRRRGFEFRVNPLGVQMDALFSQGSESFAWDGIWESAGRITAEGYVVEAGIPFRTLSFPGTAREQTWGVLFGRSWPRSEEHRVRSIRTDYDEQCLLCQAERLTGLEPGAPGHGIELNPTLTTTRTDRRERLTAPRLTDGDVELEPGFTGSWRFSPNFDLSATVNPDFSQVEADAARLESNRRFALQFEEKRPFFLEGSDIFEIPGQLVFTRTVVDPVAGVKLTGKEGGNRVGAFLTRDRVTTLLFPGPQGSSGTQLEQDVTGAVGRWQRDVGESSYVGFVATDREGAGYHNRLVAADARLRIGPSTTLGYLVGLTHTDYPDDVADDFDQPEDGFWGHGLAVFGSHETRDWSFNATVSDVDREFRADAGFLPQTAVRELTGFWQRRLWTPDLDWATRFVVDGFVQYSLEQDGDLLTRGGDLEVRYEGPLQTEVGVEVGWEQDRFRNRLFSLPRQELSAEIQPSGALTLSADLTTGKTIDFANGRRADLLRVGPSVEWRAGRHLSLEAGHDLERLSRGGEAVLTEHVSELRAVYHFSVEAYLRAIVQHRDVSRAPDRFVDPVAERDRNVFGQLLFSYELNPRSVLYAGYTDTWRGRERERFDVSLRETRRTFFLKLGYALRL